MAVRILLQAIILLPTNTFGKYVEVRTTYFAIRKCNVIGAKIIFEKYSIL
jgi:hypothetical protein